MKRHWTHEESLEYGAHLVEEGALIGDRKFDHYPLGFAVLLKYFPYEGRFPGLVLEQNEKVVEGRSCHEKGMY